MSAIFKRILLLAAILAVLPRSASAQTPLGSETVARFTELIEQAQPPSGVTMHGAVKFFHGNNQWQPGRQFKAGRAWLALACSAEGCALEPATLAVKRKSWQGLRDDAPTQGQKLEFRLEAPSKGRVVVAWFHTLGAPPWIKARGVPTSRSPQRALRRPQDRGTLEVAVDLPGGGEALLVPLLVQEEDANRANHAIANSIMLQLRVKGARQMLPGLLDTSGGPDGGCKSYDWDSWADYLLWAGDLDGDGRLDLLVKFGGGYGSDDGYDVHLYLSSAAKARQIVGLAGVSSSQHPGSHCQ